MTHGGVTVTFYPDGSLWLSVSANYHSLQLYPDGSVAHFDEFGGVVEKGTWDPKEGTLRGLAKLPSVVVSQASAAVKAALAERAKAPAAPGLPADKADIEWVE